VYLSNFQLAAGGWRRARRAHPRVPLHQPPNRRPGLGLGTEVGGRGQRPTPVQPQATGRFGAALLNQGARTSDLAVDLRVN
jgi:hypothetical protein